MLPETAMDGLTPEDLRLLLNGVGDINVNLLISYTSFSDESGPGNGDKVTKIKRWLWSIVEKMTQMERMDLVSTNSERNWNQVFSTMLITFNMFFTGLLLDRFAGVASFGRWIPAYAKRYDKTTGRFAFTDREYVYFATIHTDLQFQEYIKTETIVSY